MPYNKKPADLVYAMTKAMVETYDDYKAAAPGNIGWAKELIVDGESGFLVYPKNHQDYAQRIIAVLADDDLVAQIGKKARERVERLFDIDKIALENFEVEEPAPELKQEIPVVEEKVMPPTPEIPKLVEIVEEVEVNIRY